MLTILSGNFKYSLHVLPLICERPLDNKIIFMVLDEWHFDYFYCGYVLNCGFGDLGVACWPLVPKFAGSNPAEAVGFLRAKKILSTPSFRGEVKPSVPCR